MSKTTTTEWREFAGAVGEIAHDPFMSKGQKALAIGLGSFAGLVLGALAGAAIMLGAGWLVSVLAWPVLGISMSAWQGAGALFLAWLLGNAFTGSLRGAIKKAKQ